MAVHELNPTISCTRVQLCFFAWQRAQGRTDLAESGVHWQAFMGWWEGRDLVYFLNLHQLARAAWNASSGEFESQLTTDEDRRRFDAWWSGVVRDAAKTNTQSRNQRQQRSAGT